MNYVLERLRSNSRHVAELARIDGEIRHPGVKGRFRELLVNNLLMPWLPAGVACGTGIIVDHRGLMLEAGQEDVVVFDPTLSPSVLASPNSTHGVFFFDNVLLRIEVKSTLRRDDIGRFVESSQRLSQLHLAVGHGDHPAVPAAFNMLVAFDSEVAVGRELESLRSEISERHTEPVSGIVSGMCVATRGFWLLGEDRGARMWKVLTIEDKADPLAYFTAVVSNSCFSQRAARQGLKPLGGGIGNYVPHPFEFVPDR